MAFRQMQDEEDERQLNRSFDSDNMQSYQNYNSNDSKFGRKKQTLEYKTVVEDQSERKREVIHLFFGDVDQHLLVSKLFYFFFYAAFGSLFPLISIFFKQLGMSAIQVGLLVGIRPFVEYASVPLWGFLAHRYKREKLILIFSLLSWIVFTLALNFVPSDPSFCLVDNGTYAEIQALGKKKFFTADNTNYGPRMTEDMNKNFLYVEQSRIAGMSPIYLTKDLVNKYPDDIDDNELVKPPYSTNVYRRSVVGEVFLLLLVLIIIGEFCSAPAIMLADSCTLRALGEHPELYGKQRMFGSVGWAISMFIIGIALDQSLVFSSHPCGQTNLHEKNYTTCFAAFCVLMGCALIMCFLFRYDRGSLTNEISNVIMDLRQSEVDPVVAENARAKAPEPQEAARGPHWLSTLKTFSSPHYITFLFVAWWFGFGIGLVFCFLFWHLQDIGGSPTLYGIASVINHLSEIFIYFFSYQLINSFGHIKVLYLGLIANVCRFLYISWLANPWWVLPFEFVQGITHAAVWAAFTSYISLASPPQYKSSAQSILQNLHHGIGRASGTLIGAIFIAFKGTQFTFRLYGLVSLAVLAVFYAINRFFKVSGFKYQSDGFEDDEDHFKVLDPHGIPMLVPYSRTEERLAPSSTSLYGATDPTQAAYDRYIHEPYEKPVKFEALPKNFGKR